MPTPEPVTELIELLHLQPTQSVIDTLAGWYNTHAAGGAPAPAVKPFVSGGTPPYKFVLETPATVSENGVLSATIGVTDSAGGTVTKTFTAPLT